MSVESVCREQVAPFFSPHSLQQLPTETLFSFLENRHKGPFFPALFTECSTATLSVGHGIGCY